MGIGVWRWASSCCSSSPLRPGSRTSSTRQLGAAGRWRVKNSCAEANVWTFSPVERSRLLRLARVDWSSSTTQTHGWSSCIAAPPVPRYQPQPITLCVSRLCERRLYDLEEIRLAAGFGQHGHRASGQRARTSSSAYAVTKMIAGARAPPPADAGARGRSASAGAHREQARRLGCVRGLQERFCRREALHAKSHGAEQIIGANSAARRHRRQAQ